MIKSYKGKVVLITGGTKGIGLACGLAFASLGAQLVLTHRWGSADEQDILAQFAKTGGPVPLILEADASQPKDTKALMATVAEQFSGGENPGVDVFISNVCVVMRGDGVDNHNRRALLKSLDYSAWPFLDYMHQIHKQFGRYPEYAVAMSSDGPDSHYPGYDYVAVAKAVLETFVRYMATHLRDENVKINALRTRQVITDSFAQIFGEERIGLSEQFSEFAVTAEEVADTTVAMCSGMLDSLSGQVLTLDRGAAFVDNVMTLGHRLAQANQAAPPQGEKKS